MLFSKPAGQKFVSRDSISDYDFTKTTLIQDDIYHDLDLSLIVPSGNIAVLIQYRLSHSNANEFMKLKEKGVVTDYNAFVWVTPLAAQEFRGFCIVYCDKDRKLEYLFTTPAWSQINLIVSGWWV